MHQTGRNDNIRWSEAVLGSLQGPHTIDICVISFFCFFPSQFFKQVVVAYGLWSQLFICSGVSRAFIYSQSISSSFTVYMSSQICIECSLSYIAILYCHYTSSQNTFASAMVIFLK